jgi:hypothetical protein
VQLLRDLVARHVLAAVDVELGERGRGAVPWLHDRGHPLTPPLVGDADDDGVEDGGMGLERRLDLLGEDLLAARVDALRPAAQQRDGAVGPVTNVAADFSGSL